MCGISGIFMKDGKAVDPALLAAFERALHHRGPDHDGRFLSGPFALAHNRLSIVDLVTGDQPLFGEKGAVLAANGDSALVAPLLVPAVLAVMVALGVALNRFMGIEPRKQHFHDPHDETEQ